MWIRYHLRLRTMLTNFHLIHKKIFPACYSVINFWKYYSRVHKSSDSFFSKILEKPSILQKKMIPHRNELHFSMNWSKKKFQNGRLKNSKWPPQKKTHFPALPILNIFSWKFHGLVLGLVELIDAKGIGVAQPIWHWGCPI